MEQLANPAIWQAHLTAYANKLLLILKEIDEFFPCIFIR